jgi:hypothetical protein
MSLTAGHSPEYLAADKSNELWNAAFITWPLATIAMALRFYCRRLTHQKLGLDDWFIITSYVSPT